MSETKDSRNNSPIYLVSVRHSVKATMKLTANFLKNLLVKDFEFLHSKLCPIARLMVRGEQDRWGFSGG